jgi:flagellar basal-body rod modification protein FlgD
MDVQGIGQPTVGTRSDLPRGLSNLRSDDFFKIMISELRQQDPFEPAKTSDMIGQVSQIRDIELSGKLTDTLDRLTQQQKTTGASELIGKLITADVPIGDGTNATVQGVVTGIRFNSDGTASLELDTGDMVLASQVTRVTSPELAGTAAATGAAAPPASPNAAAGAAAADSNAAADGKAAAKPQRRSLFSLEGLQIL